MARTEIFLSDMSKCTPAAALSFRADKDRWIARTYEAPGVEGVCLMAFGVVEAPQLSYALDLQGFYAIHVGVWDPKGPPSRPRGNAVKIKLSDDSCFRFLSYDAPSKWPVIQEGFWKSADLSGQSLVIAQEAGKRAGLAWIRLVPVTAEELEAERKNRPDKIVIAKVDTEDLTTEEAVCEQIEPYRHSDVTKFFLSTRLDVTEYPTRIGDTLASRVEEVLGAGQLVYTDFARDDASWARYAGELKSLYERGLDPIHLVSKKAHEVGMETHLCFRIGMWSFYENSDPSNSRESPFYQAHPEWRCRDRDGTEIPTMSYVFPQVREYVQAIIREGVEDHIDLLSGFNVLYIRGPVFLLYEEPLVEGFKQVDGRDPRKIDEMDPAWLKHKAQTLTSFMRGLKSLRDELDEKYGKRLDISANVFCDEEMNLRLGLDLRTWVEEGLVDLLIPMIFPWPHPHGAFDVDFFAQLHRASDCKICPMLSYACRTPKEGAERTHEAYDAGLDGVFFWDSQSNDIADWAVKWRLGHVDQVREWAEADVDPGIPGEYGYEPAFPTQLTPIDRLGERTIGRYYVNSGG